MRAFACTLAMLLPLFANAAEPCQEPKGTRIWLSPATPHAGAPLRILAVSEDDLRGEIVIEDAEKETHALSTTHRGGPPFSLSAELRPKAGNLRVEIRSGGKTTACRRVTVDAKPAKPETKPSGEGAWVGKNAWSPAYEAYFSAWIEALFDAPVDANLSFPSLAPVIRDPARNLLWGHLGLDEDNPKNRSIAKATPDCADLPYYLRAYFAWKLNLPFALRDCDRGKPDRPPRCGEILHNEMPAQGSDRLSRFTAFLSTLANRVHSGSARTALTDDQTDFYPVPLERKRLRPGIIYADPYGHVLMVAKWVDQTAQRGGLLLAVDGQPDNSVGRKRFWEGTFLYTNDSPSAGPGFKAFRPIERGPDGAITQLPNATLATDRRFATFSDEQGKLGRDAFYARMAKVINPRGLDAATAYRETLGALLEQLVTRIGSVENGEKFMREKRNPVVPMPTGPKIFETTGPWEDYATPSRDMRLLIALRVLAELPARIMAHPELFILGAKSPKDARAEIEALHQTEINKQGIEYRRSNGSTFRLTVSDLLARREALGMAYNPNDCVEVRWGATPGSPDYATCQRHAPDDQRQPMRAYLPWFQETRRPPR